MNIHEMIEIIKKDPSCEVFQSNGIPNLNEGDELPVDIQQFYNLCGGIHFFKVQSMNL